MKGLTFIVFCHEAVAYLVPLSVAEAAERHDLNYEANVNVKEALAFITDIKKRYPCFPVGYLFTGDIG